MALFDLAEAFLVVVAAKSETFAEQRANKEDLGELGKIHFLACTKIRRGNFLFLIVMQVQHSAHLLHVIYFPLYKKLCTPP